jgi:E3 ubiquitin-protein ligase RAD18
MLHNSNLDRSLANRKSKAELRKELKKWEDEMLKKKKAVIRDVREYQVRWLTSSGVFHLFGTIDPTKR